MSTVTVNYAFDPISNPESSTLRKEVYDIAFLEPVSAYKYIQERRDDIEYIFCPAFADYCKNAYFILAPYNIKVVPIVETGQVALEGLLAKNAKLINSLLYNRTKPNDSNPFLVTLNSPRIVFWANESVYAESIPVFLDSSPHIANTNHIPGTFDIGKWVRPVDFSFEIVDPSKPIVINRGDPLFCIRFRTKDNSKVILKRQRYDEPLCNAISNCVNVKKMLHNKPLSFLYDLAAPYFKMTKFGVKEKKCPFKWLHKDK